MKKRLLSLFFGCAALSITAICIGHEGHDHDLAAMPTSPSVTSTPSKSDSPPMTSPSDLKKVSETFGNYIGKTLANPNAGLQFDIESVIKGIRDGAQGRPSPMTEQEYEKAVMSFQETAYKNLSEKNIKAANEFMAQNQKERSVVTLEPGKLQYMILKEGSGNDAVKEHGAPLISYVGKFQDGTVFGSSEDMGPITIQLDKTIPGFTKGLVGMKKGEKRRLFIHPDLAYGTRGDLPPNALLIFDVEVVNTEGKDLDAANDSSSDNDDNRQDMGESKGKYNEKIKPSGW